MKIEKLNETQVRVTLNKADLVEREIKISELAYGSEKAQKLFKDMMKKAFDEFGFEASDVPLMIEAVPLSTESIMIIVTKVDEPEELDEKLANLTPNKNIRKFKRKDGEEVESLDLDDADEEEEPIFYNEDKSEPSKASSPSLYLYTFKALDDVIHASHSLDLVDVNSLLFKDKKMKRFYLLLKSGRRIGGNVDKLLIEYGERLSTSLMAEGYLKEHAEVMIDENALDKLKLI